ncbi:hypothetical protein CICLE_v10030111mg, partial [Citrus x clementina]
IQSEVSFLPQDLKLIQSPHDDALVISIKIGNCLIRRILIDNRSLVNRDKIKPFEQPLVGFSGMVAYTDGVVTLPVIAVPYMTSPYNTIVGRQWIYRMKVVPSTYHQVLHYPKIYGTRKIRGDQVTA